MGCLKSGLELMRIDCKLVGIGGSESLISFWLLGFLIKAAWSSDCTHILIDQAVKLPAALWLWKILSDTHVITGEW